MVLISFTTRPQTRSRLGSILVMASLVLESLALSEAFALSSVFLKRDLKTLKCSTAEHSLLNNLAIPWGAGLGTTLWAWTGEGESEGQVLVLHLSRCRLAVMADGASLLEVLQSFGPPGLGSRPQA